MLCQFSQKFLTNWLQHHVYHTVNLQMHNLSVPFVGSSTQHLASRHRNQTIYKIVQKTVLHNCVLEVTTVQTNSHRIFRVLECHKGLQTIFINSSFRRNYITYADCQGVMTPSCGPPIKIKFLSFEKFVF